MAKRRQAVRQHRQILAQQHQWIIDSEVHATRRALLAGLRRHGGLGADRLLDDDFLTVADRPTLVNAIIELSLTVGAADRCDLQFFEPDTATLTIGGHRGFNDEFLRFFATVDETRPTACAVALTIREPILVDNITTSPIFIGQPTLEPMLDVGTRAVHSHPLLNPDGTVAAVLSFHYDAPKPRRGQPELVAWAAAKALTYAPTGA